MPGSISKSPRANKDGTYSWLVTVPAGYGRHASRIVRSVRVAKLTKHPPQKARDLLARLQSQAEGGVVAADTGQGSRQCPDVAPHLGHVRRLQGQDADVADGFA